MPSQSLGFNRQETKEILLKLIYLDSGIQVIDLEVGSD